MSWLDDLASAQKINTLDSLNKQGFFSKQQIGEKLGLQNVNVIDKFLRKRKYEKRTYAFEGHQFKAYKPIADKVSKAR